MSKTPWRLLTRLENVNGNFQRVTVYERMARKQLNRMIKNGWSWIE